MCLVIYIQREKSYFLSHLFSEMVWMEDMDANQVELGLHKIFKSQLGFFEDSLLTHTMNMINEVSSEYLHVELLIVEQEL